uniref:DRBM domain-containing protein n=1 Tax=Kalanchoe fedtschenkoi TaxID=63787 RepID=A0A7N0TV54_KALFE
MSRIPGQEGMHKSQLQELCQRRSWPLPEYTTLQEGPPHRPSFKATVVVNGLAFHTSDYLKRAKDAHTEAAKLALSHFTSTSTAPENKIMVSTAQDCAGIGEASSVSINLNKQPTTDEVGTLVQHEQAHPPENASGAKPNKHPGDLHMYKNQLQSVVMKKGYGLPIYTFEREGPPHNSRFKAKVTVNGQTYESANLFSTLKESEQAAAKVALFSLVPPESQDVSLDNSIFKNLLQEYAQKSGLQLPTYDTTGSGAHHIPKFVSTVVVGGNTFSGQEAKTKKLAEMNAAKVAYTCLSRCGNLGPSSSVSIYVPKGVSASNLKATDTADSRETSKLGASSKLIDSQGVSGLPAV